MSAREGCATALSVVCRRAALRPQPEPVRRVFDPAHAAELTIQCEDAADSLGLGGINDKRPLAYAVAEGRVAAHPHALLFRRGDLVADPFAGDLALELGKGQQHIEGQPAHLVDDHDLDPAGPDIGEQVLQRGPLQIAAGEPAIIITGLRQHPAFVLLAADVGLTGFALRGQRVEFLLQPLLGGFAGVDRATLAARVTPRHCYCPSARWLDPVVGRSAGWRTGPPSTRKRADLTTPCR